MWCFTSILPCKSWNVTGVSGGMMFSLFRLSAGVEWQQNQRRPWCFSRETTQPHTSKPEWQQIERHQHVGTIGMIQLTCALTMHNYFHAYTMCIFSLRMLHALCFVLSYLMLLQTLLWLDKELWIFVQTVVMYAAVFMSMWLVVISWIDTLLTQ